MVEQVYSSALQQDRYGGTGVLTSTAAGQVWNRCTHQNFSRTGMEQVYSPALQEDRYDETDVLTRTAGGQI